MFLPTGAGLVEPQRGRIHQTLRFFGLDNLRVPACVCRLHCPRNQGPRYSRFSSPPQRRADWPWQNSSSRACFFCAQNQSCPERCKWPTPYLARALRVFLPGRNISSTTHHPIDCMTINLYLLRASMTFFATAITPSAMCKSFASCPVVGAIAYGRPVFHAERSPVRLASLSANT